MKGHFFILQHNWALNPTHEQNGACEVVPNEVDERVVDLEEFLLENTDGGRLSSSLTTHAPLRDLDFGSEI